ncbi:MAG: hypothetical protein Q4G70_12205 [Pseudomonadota bacterium]|nr:hypothetical protein [Pseudomonadota bacterium]
MPVAVFAQGTVEPAEAAPHSDMQPVVTAPAPDQRSPLRLAVEAAHRQHEASGAAQDMRLSPEQRQLLREQIRRAALHANGDWPGDAPPDRR